MYDQYPVHDVPNSNLIQRFFAQRWSAIALEIVMTIVITVAAGAAFDFFDPLDRAAETSAYSAEITPSAVAVVESKTKEPLDFIKARGAAYIRERRFDAAEAMFDWAIALAPDDVESYSWRGYAKMQAGDYAAAQVDYREVLARKPGDFNGQSALCRAYGETRDFTRAEAHCRQALDIAFNRSEFAIALENWCWLQVEMGNYAEAAKDCRFSLEYAPEYEELQALANYNMGRVLMAQGRPAEALAHFHEALRIGSSYAKMYLEIGMIYDRLGYHAAAQATFANYRQFFGDGAGRAQAVGMADG